MVLSGFAGLGYEMVWTKMLAVGLGHEIVAVLAVVAAFFVGLAVGAWLLHKPVSQAERPWLWYAGLEVVIGCWALLLIGFIPVFNEALPALIGERPSALRQWASIFLATLLLLLPATAAMGATLPAMERLLSSRSGNGWQIGGLYAANTLGAVVGILVTIFVLAPQLGFSATLIALACANFVCAIAVLALRKPSGVIVPRPRQVIASPSDTPSAARLGALMAATGLIGIGYEVLVIRALGQVLENTIYTFASLLSVYLLGTAVGAALYQVWSPRERFPQVLSVLLQLLCIACLLGVWALSLSERLHYALTNAFGNGTVAAVSGEMAVALSVFLLPTLLMGAVFAHLAQAGRDSLGLGPAIAINTAAGAAAPLIFGVVLLPVVGTKVLLIGLCVGYLTLLPLGASYRQPSAILPAALATGLLLSSVSLRFVDIPADGKLLSYDDGVMASVAVVADGNDVRYLKVNNHYTMGSSISGFSDRRQTHIPMLLHPAPKEALYLGVGTGSTFAAAAAHPGLRATAVELIPEVLPMLEYFGPSAEAISEHEQLDVVQSDARRFVQANQDSYDVIVAEVFHPSRDGAGSLYTVEHFSAVRSRLRDDGLFCQWLPLFQLDVETLRVIVRSFLEVFPDSEAHLAHFSLGQPLVALVGRQSPGTHYYRGWLTDRVQDAALIEELNALRLNTDFALLGGFLAGKHSLAKFAESAPLNTDDHPIVTFRAPGFVYGGPQPASSRLLALIAELDPLPAQLVDAAAPNAEEFSTRLAGYWRARDEFLRAGIGIQPSDDLRQMLAQIGNPAAFRRQHQQRLCARLSATLVAGSRAVSGKPGALPRTPGPSGAGRARTLGSDGSAATALWRLR